jgi:hypothetical protein
MKSRDRRRGRKRRRRKRRRDRINRYLERRNIRKWIIRKKRKTIKKMRNLGREKETRRLENIEMDANEILCEYFKWV